MGWRLSRAIWPLDSQRRCLTIRTIQRTCSTLTSLRVPPDAISSSLKSLPRRGNIALTSYSFPILASIRCAAARPASSLSKAKREAEQAARQAAIGRTNAPEVALPADDDNTGKTYREFAEKWLPFHARKRRFSPNSYDSYKGNLDNHILPYFGDCVMSAITSEAVDNFVDYLAQRKDLKERLEESNDIIRSVFALIQSTLYGGDSIGITGLFTLGIKRKDAWKWFNGRTQEAVHYSERLAPYCHFTRSFKRTLNEHYEKV